MAARRYTEEQFRRAAADPEVRTMADLCRALDLVPRGANYETLRRYGKALGVPLRQRPGRSSAVNVDDATLRAAVAANRSMAATIRALGGKPSGGAFQNLRRRIDSLGLDVGHWVGQGWARGRRFPERSKPIGHYLRPDRSVPSAWLRRRLIKEGLKDHLCEHCGLQEWNGRPIPLELDHVDGNRIDNTLENLRLLCPNCHALTPTYRGRNIGRYGEGSMDAQGAHLD